MTRNASLAAVGASRPVTLVVAAVVIIIAFAASAPAEVRAQVAEQGDLAGQLFFRHEA